MTKTYKVGIIGLGIIGRRMLENMPRNGRLEVAAGWDLDPGAAEAAKRDFPWLNVAADADAVISDPDIDVIYIGVPPKAHGQYARAAFEAGKAVFCEKPLGVDLDDSRALVDLAATRPEKQAVNLSLAGSRAVQHMRKAIAEGELGEIIGADIRLHFTQWPRGWQANATWLSQREEGGFVREVATHFLYLAESLLGHGKVTASSARYPDDGTSAETHALAQLDYDGIPATLAGSVGGAGPDQIEFTLWGTKCSYKLTEFYRLWRSEGADWEPALKDIENPALDAYMLQLEELVAMLDGRPHVLPSFQTALDVQRHVETILAALPAGAR